MTAITLHLPDDLAARLAAMPADELNAGAARALADLVSSSNDEDPDQGLSDAERAAVRDGISCGLTDSRAGRVTPLAEWAARKLQQFDLAPEQGHNQDAA